MIYSPLVSIIVASYNNEQYLDDMIQSVINQTYTNWELIITDDASPDNSNKIIEKYLTDKRIKLFKHDENKGAGAAFKTCTDNVKGEIVAMLGADDALKPEALEVLVNEYKKKPDAAMIIGGLEHTDENLCTIDKQTIFGNLPNGVNSILENGYALGWDTFKIDYYKKTEGFTEEQKRAVDQDLYFKMEEVGKIYFIEKCLYLYRENENGISQSNNWLLALKHKINAIEKAIKRRGLRKRNIKVCNKYKHDFYLNSAIVQKKSKKYFEAVINVFKTFYLKPEKDIYLKLNILFKPLKFWKIK